MIVRPQEGIITIKNSGVQKIMIYPKIPASRETRRSYNFKGVELRPAT